MRIKTIAEFVKEKSDYVTSVDRNLRHEDTDYRIEVVSSSERLNKTGDMDIMSTLAIWNEDNNPESISFHVLYEIPLTVEQMTEAVENIIKSPALFIKP